MSITYFVHYEDDGKLVGFTYEERKFYDMRKENGEKVLEVDHQFDFKQYKLDMSTMTVIPKTPEEIAADAPKPIEIPVYIAPIPVDAPPTETP